MDAPRDGHVRPSTGMNVGPFPVLFIPVTSLTYGTIRPESLSAAIS